ncbi:hypothetical protein OPT61_g2867 [Boeremia exigua]|uniref:Uncharacterized protein n=1 Tax=Boeremia exigua TaxID=749465 RepID=A0ACC2IK57_9PLEO|nr:hypothetical protein OPT61_g2867 [Boeremia exigua]
MLALTLRRAASSSAQFNDQSNQDLGTLVENSWNSLSDAYRRFEFDESFFQAACLLAQVDFAEGGSDRARIQITLCLRLAQTRGMLNAGYYKDMDALERKQHLEIVWSLFILDRIFIGGSVSVPTTPGLRFTLPTFLGGPGHPDQASSVYGVTDVPPIVRNPGIVGQYIQLMRTWELVAEYINKDSTVDRMPIWHHDSPRTAILADLLESEIPCELHTYASVSPIDRVLQQPHLESYFRAWIHFQVTHSATHCCVNHPFIIFVKARRHGSRVPLTFLQKAHKDSLIYASWVARTISDMNDAQLDVLDPFLAYLVGIAASIHVEHSSNFEISIASSAKQKLATCMAYLMRVSQVWPKVRKRIAVLQDLQNRIGSRSALHFVEDEYDGAVPVRSLRHVSLSSADEQLMWTLFDCSNESKLDMSHRATSASGVVDYTANDAVQIASAEPDAGVTACLHGTQTAPAIEPISSIDAWNPNWSLLGMPWPAYFPSDTSPLDDLSIP